MAVVWLSAPAGTMTTMVDGTHPERSVQDEAAVRALEAAYDEAWNRADLDALVSPFAPDATIVDPFGGVSSGRDEIRGLLSALLAGRGRGSTHTSTILSVTFVSADVALADGEAVIEGLHDAAGVVTAAPGAPGSRTSSSGTAVPGGSPTSAPTSS